MFSKTIKDDFLVIDQLKLLCEDLNCKVSGSKDKLAERISDKAKEGETVRIHINNQIEKFIREGTKHCFFRIFEKPKNSDLGIFTENLDKYEDKYKNWVNEVYAGNDLTLYRVDYFKNDVRINIVKLSYVIALYEKKDSVSTNKIKYPVFVDINLDVNSIVFRMKSKSNLFYISSENGADILGSRFSEKSIISKIEESIEDIFSISFKSESNSTERIKDSFYNLLAKYTKTPRMVQNSIDSMSTSILSFTEILHTKLQINNKYRNEIETDLKLLVEKFVSASVPDIHFSIFKSDRDAYPVGVKLTNRQKTQISQVSTDRAPLQTKDVFFDYKKVLQKEKFCDSLAMIYKEKNNIDREFPVFLSVKNNSLLFDFRNHTKEEDILNVISFFE